MQTMTEMMQIGIQGALRIMRAPVIARSAATGNLVATSTLPIAASLRSSQ